MAHLLGAESVSVSYPTAQPLRGVTTGVDEGIRIGIMGRNGDSQVHAASRARPGPGAGRGKRQNTMRKELASLRRAGFGRMLPGQLLVKQPRSLRAGCSTLAGIRRHVRADRLDRSPVPCTTGLGGGGMRRYRRESMRCESRCHGHGWRRTVTHPVSRFGAPASELVAASESKAARTGSH